MVSEVAIRGEMIRLGQLLKVAGLIDSGAEVKAFLSERAVLVNGEREDRRGRQLHPGDVVTHRRPGAARHGGVRAGQTRPHWSESRAATTSGGR